MVCTCADADAFWGPHAAMRTLIPVVLVQRKSVPVLEGGCTTNRPLVACRAVGTSKLQAHQAHGVHVSMDAKQASPGTASGDGRTDTSSLCSPLCPIL